jgi:hypothetical protein
MDEVPQAVDCACGDVRRRVYRAPQVSVFQEYVTDNINGQPERIGSRGQERDLCNRYGVARVGTGDIQMKRHKPVMLPPFKEYFLKTKHELGIV